MPLFEFTNGLYSADRLLFYPWLDASGRTAQEALTADGVDCAARLNRFAVECFADGRVPYMDIPTPTLDRLVGHQVAADDRAAVLPWIYCHLGRLMYPLGVHDGWHTLPVIYGTPDTGKSTLAEMLTSIPGADNVMTLGLHGGRITKSMHGKAMWVCPAWDTTYPHLQTLSIMVFGDGMPVTHAGVMKWRSPGFVCADSLPDGLKTQDGYRCIVPLCFKNAVADADRECALSHMLQQEMGCIIPKLARAYRDHARRDAHVMSVVPRTVQAWRRHDILCQLEPVVDFLCNSGRAVLDAEAYCLETVFRKELTRFLVETRGVRRGCIGLHPHHFRAPAVEIVHGSAPWDGEVARGRFILGVRHCDHPETKRVNFEHS
jgi:hypothetical protein